MEVKVFYFTGEETEYIINQILLAKSSLEECCDAYGKLAVDFITQEEYDEEYKLIKDILERLKYHAE